MPSRVLVLTHQDYKPPQGPEEDVPLWKTERHVIEALERLGHKTKTLGAVDELPALRASLTSWKPDIVFNLLEEFQGREIYVPYVLGYFELLDQPFTGCNPSGLMLTDNKALMKKILRYHRIPMPDFAVFQRGRVVRRPARLNFPLIVKSSSMHGSVGIAQASLVTSDEKFKERVTFVHEHLHTDAVAETYIEGREIYVGVIGNHRLETLPVWELNFDNLAEGASRIATQRVKWDANYQEARGIRSAAATKLPNGAASRINKLCRRVYRILNMSGYARMDFRLTERGQLYLLEPNPNPDLSRDEEFGEASAAAGIPYERLIQKILNLGFRYSNRST